MDVLTEIGGDPVDGPQELEFRLATLGPGSTAEILYWRDGREAAAEIALAPPPDVGDLGAVRIRGGTIFDGLTVATLGPALIDQLDLPLDVDGVVITGLEGGAVRTGLRPGDILVAVNGRAIRTADDLVAAGDEPTRLWQIEFLRGGRRAVIRLSGG